MLNSHKNILFYRDFHGLTGGHLKLWHYFNHVNANPFYQSQIYFTPESSWDETNPWLTVKQACLPTWQPESADVLFVDALDWHVLPTDFYPHSPKPIINLIQGMRHSLPDNPRYALLKNKAIRICVSEQVADAIKASGQVNGPVFVNPNGLDWETYQPQPHPSQQRTIDVLIVGKKQPHLAQRLQQVLSTEHQHVEALTQVIPRARFLEKVNQAKLALFLPHPTDGEGFFMPPLEAMMLRTLVVCPDCVGNRSFCLPQINCFRPDNMTEETLLTAVRAAQALMPQQREAMLNAGSGTAKHYTLERERATFLQILANITQIW